MSAKSTRSARSLLSAVTTLLILCGAALAGASQNGGVAEIVHRAGEVITGRAGVGADVGAVVDAAGALDGPVDVPPLGSRDEGYPGRGLAVGGAGGNKGGVGPGGIGGNDQGGDHGVGPAPGPGERNGKGKAQDGGNQGGNGKDRGLAVGSGGGNQGGNTGSSGGNAQDTGAPPSETEVIQER